MYSWSDFDNFHLSNCSQSMIDNFLKLISDETLGRKILVALNQRKQGHFDKAMLSISEANRDQVLAIREIQTILSKPENQSQTEIVFKNFRQTFPFQIGISNGEEVLALLANVKQDLGDEFLAMTRELFDNEGQICLLDEESIFLENKMAGKVSGKEINSIAEKKLALYDRIFSIKKYFLYAISDCIFEKKYLCSDDDELRLIRCIYLIVTSSTETLDAKFVEV